MPTDKEWEDVCNRLMAAESRIFALEQIVADIRTNLDLEREHAEYLALVEKRETKD